MIQDSDEQIEERYEKTNPYYLQMKLTEYFRDSFKGVFDFNAIKHYDFVISDDGMSATYDKDKFVFQFDPYFLLKGNHHLKGDKIRGLDAKRYVQCRTQTVTEMLSVLDLLNYRISNFVKQMNQLGFNVSAMSDPIGLSHNANLSSDARIIRSFCMVHMVYGLEYLNRDDATIDNAIQFQIVIDEEYMKSSVHVIQWHSDYTNIPARNEHHCMHPLYFREAQFLKF